MDATSIVTIVQSIGFPIVMCGAMAWFVKYMYDRNQALINDLTAKHHAEMESITTAVNNNTSALNAVLSFINEISETEVKK